MAKPVYDWASLRSSPYGGQVQRPLGFACVVALTLLLLDVGLVISPTVETNTLVVAVFTAVWGVLSMIGFRWVHENTLRPLGVACAVVGVVCTCGFAWTWWPMARLVLFCVLVALVVVFSLAYRRRFGSCTLRYLSSACAMGLLLVAVLHCVAWLVVGALAPKNVSLYGAILMSMAAILAAGAGWGLWGPLPCGCGCRPRERCGAPREP